MNEVESIRKELRLIVREIGLLSHNCLNSGMTLAQAHVLNYLKQNGITPFSELLLELGIDKASLSRILNNLVSKNYIKMENSSTDKRTKCVSILSLGIEAAEKADYEANKYMSKIFSYNNIEMARDIMKSLREFHILALKNNIINNKLRIKIERLPENYKEYAIRLATEVFTYEQNIPEQLIPIKEELKPIWWCARVGEDVIGVVASWTENNHCHWGRFAVDKRLRGLGIGKRIAIISLSEIFTLNIEKVFIEARDITVKLLGEFGCKILGESIDFYGEPVTPIVITKSDFRIHYSKFFDSVCFKSKKF